MHYCEWFRQKGSGCTCKALKDVAGNATTLGEHGKHYKNEPTLCSDRTENIDCRGITYNIVDELAMSHLACPLSKAYKEVRARLDEKLNRNTQCGYNAQQVTTRACNVRKEICRDDISRTLEKDHTEKAKGTENRFLQLNVTAID